MSEELKENNDVEHLISEIRKATTALSLTMHDALEEEKGIDLPEIRHHKDDLAPYVIVDGVEHNLHVFIIPDGEHTEWIYIISPSLDSLKGSVRLMFDGLFKDRYDRLDEAIDNYHAVVQPT